MTLRDMVLRKQELGYGSDDARAAVCQDIILKAIAESWMKKNSCGVFVSLYLMIRECGKMICWQL